MEDAICQLFLNKGKATGEQGNPLKGSRIPCRPHKLSGNPGSGRKKLGMGPLNAMKSYK